MPLKEREINGSIMSRFSRGRGRSAKRSPSPQTQAEHHAKLMLIEIDENEDIRRTGFGWWEEKEDSKIRKLHKFHKPVYKKGKENEAGTIEEWMNNNAKINLQLQRQRQKQRQNNRKQAISYEFVLQSKPELLKIFRDIRNEEIIKQQSQQLIIPHHHSNQVSLDRKSQKSNKSAKGKIKGNMFTLTAKPFSSPYKNPLPFKTLTPPTNFFPSSSSSFYPTLSRSRIKMQVLSHKRQLVSKGNDKLKISEDHLWGRREEGGYGKIKRNKQQSKWKRLNKYKLQIQ